MSPPRRDMMYHVDEMFPGLDSWLPQPQPWESPDVPPMGPRFDQPPIADQPDDYETFLRNYVERGMQPQGPPPRRLFADRFADAIAANPIPQRGRTDLQQFVSGALGAGLNTFARNRIAMRPQMEDPEDRLKRVAEAAKALREHLEWNRKQGEGPNPVTLGPGQVLINPRTGRQVASIPKPAERIPPVTLSPESRLVDPVTGRVIATGASKEGPPKDKSAASSGYAATIAQDAIAGVDDVFNRINWQTTGVVGKATSYIPGTPAYDVNQKLKTVLSNVAFKALADMRAASKTGGALGQVSDKEGQLLQAVKGNVDQGQSTPEVRRSLRRVKASMMRLANAAAMDEGQPIPFPGAPEWNYDGSTPLPGETAERKATGTVPLARPGVAPADSGNYDMEWDARQGRLVPARGRR